MKLSVEDSPSRVKQFVAEKEHWQRINLRSWPWLLIGAGLLLFSYGASNVPIAAWFSPVFLLRFVRQQKFRLWVPVLYITAIGAIRLSIARNGTHTGSWLPDFPSSQWSSIPYSISGGSVAGAAN
jgi:hypothetical protein